MTKSATAQKWYKFDIAVPSGSGIENWPPEQRLILNIEGASSYRDFPDCRSIFVKTDKHEKVDEIRKLAGVKVTEMESSNLYTLQGIFCNNKEQEKLYALRSRRSNGEKAYNRYRERLIDKFHRAVWPATQPKVMAAIAKHGPKALLRDVNQDGTFLILETKSQELLKVLRTIGNGHVSVQEESPDTTREELFEMFPQKPAANLAKAPKNNKPRA